MKKYIFLILITIATMTYSQEQSLLSFDFKTGTLDTLKISDFDTNIQNERTNYNTGNLNSDYCILCNTSPTEDVFPNSNFSKKKQVSKDFDINCFPIRTSIKLFKFKNDSIKSICSGIMISRKHVLTATHCIAKHNENTLSKDSLFICPVFDNGAANPNFECSWVKRAFFFENWNLSQTDFAVLELETPVGEETGWVSIGFDSDDTSLLDGIFYKFSYPAVPMPKYDTNLYNGDTLYYNYGIVDIAYEHFLGIKNTFGILGESGSSLIKVVNNEYYTTYGVLTYSMNLRHSRFTNWKYFALKSIIINDLELGIAIDFKDFNMSVYPNPTHDFLDIECQKGEIINRIDLFDINGKKIIEKHFTSNQVRLDLSNIPRGFYILIAYTGHNKTVKKVIKY